MPDPSRLVSPVGPGPLSTAEAGERLESWKEIAAYFGREVRTVQGWEKNEGLPVHRHQHARQGSVYAFKAELDEWKRQRRSSPEQASSKSKLQWRIVLAVIGLAAIGVGFYWWIIRNRAPSSDVPSSVVVLPFVDMSPAKDQEYFADGLTEEIIDALSRVPNLHVVARTSAFAYKGKAKDIREIAKQLDVAAVLEGSVRKAGDQLRVTAQLNRASDGFHLWSQTYDRPLRDVFAVQREISQTIAVQLRAGNVSRREPTSDLEAYRLYQEGRYFFNQFLPASFPKAIERYQEAIDRDPKFALAYSGIADAYAYLAENMISPPNEVMPKAKQAAEMAVALDPSSGEAHTSLGLVKLDYEWDRPAAEQEFFRAKELNPSSSWAHHWLGHLREAQGRLDDAITEMRAAMALDPLSVPLFWDLSGELIKAGKHKEAAALLDKSLELYPDNTILLGMRARAAFAMGDRASAEHSIASAEAVAKERQEIIGILAYGAAIEGRKAEAVKDLQEAEGMRKSSYVDAIPILETCIALNDDSCSSKWLKWGHQDRSSMFVYVPLYFAPATHVSGAAPLLADIR